jgi:hypothetical protein
MEKKKKKVRNLKVRTQDARKSEAVKGGRSNIAATHNKTADALVANIRG